MSIYYCNGERLRRGIEASTNWLTQNREFVDSLNVFPIPDGDTGTNMALTLHKVLEALENAKSNHLPEVACQIADSSLCGARGSSGVILSQILRGLAEGIRNKPRINSMDIALSLRISARRAYSAIDKPVEGTILTLLREVAETSVGLAEKEKDIVKLLEHILEVGEETLLKTRDLLPALKKAGVIDAGGKGFLIMIEGILKLIMGADFKPTIKPEIPKPTIQKEKIEERYCLDFLLKAEKIQPLGDLKKKIESKGNDIVIASLRDVTKVHIHTNEPDKILAIARTYGVVSEVRIDDMQKQHSEFSSKEMGIIAVAIGDGIQELFKKLNTDIVVEGGQTMNPSVEELKSAIQQLPAKKIFLFPNNANIIAAAKQAAEISEKEVYIIPSKTIVEGIATITAFSEEETVEENIRRMESSIAEVKSGEVTQAVRDTDAHLPLKIRNGDYIGIYNHSILSVNKKRDAVLLSLLMEMVSDEDSVISIFYKDKDENIDELSQKLSNTFPDMDIELYYGGQPHSDYFVAVE